MELVPGCCCPGWGSGWCQLAPHRLMRVQDACPALRGRLWRWPVSSTAACAALRPSGHPMCCRARACSAPRLVRGATARRRPGPGAPCKALIAHAPRAAGPDGRDDHPPAEQHDHALLRRPAAAGPRRDRVHGRDEAGRPPLHRPGPQVRAPLQSRLRGPLSARACLQRRAAAERAGRAQVPGVHQPDRLLHGPDEGRRDRGHAGRRLAQAVRGHGRVGAAAAGGAHLQARGRGRPHARARAGGLRRRLQGRGVRERAQRAGGACSAVALCCRALPPCAASVFGGNGPQAGRRARAGSALV